MQGKRRQGEFVAAVLQEHETYSAHFEYLCEKLAEELTLIEQTLDEQAED